MSLCGFRRNESAAGGAGLVVVAIASGDLAVLVVEMSDARNMRWWMSVIS